VLRITHVCVPSHRKAPTFERVLGGGAKRKCLNKHSVTQMTAATWRQGGRKRPCLCNQAVLQLSGTGLAVFLVHQLLASRDQPSAVCALTITTFFQYHLSIPATRAPRRAPKMARANEITTVAGETFAAPRMESGGATTAGACHREMTARGGRAVAIAPAIGAQTSERPVLRTPLTPAAAGASDSDSEDGAGDGDNGHCCTICSYRPRYEKERGHNIQSCSAFNRECTSSPAAPSEFKTESCSCAGKAAKQKCTTKSL